MIYLNQNHKEPLYQQLYEQLKQKIIAGEWSQGKRLPAMRVLAKKLCISRNTVENAYGQLCVEGYAVSKQGCGFIVQDIQESVLDRPYKTMARIANSGRQEHQAQSDCSSKKSANYTFDFQYGNLPPESFPRQIWRRLTAESLASLESENICAYGDKQGELALRRELIDYLHDSRGIVCTPDQVVLCNGLQDALSIICTLFSDDNRILAMEDPGYDFTRIVFQNHGYTIAPIPVNASGISLDDLQHSPAKMAYITPSHQFPTGCVMPINQRMELLRWAEQVDGIILEDDYDSELRYHTRPIPALQSIDRNERVIYLGTFSKALSPALRTSYLILPQRLLTKYKTTFARYNPSVPWLQQQVMTLFMAQGHWEKHLRKMCLQNKRKHDVLVRSIREMMGERVKIHGAGGGLHLLVEVLDKTPQEVLIQKAAEHRVKVYPTRQYWLQPEKATDSLIQFGFSGLGEEEIVEGVALLCKAWF